MTPEALRDRLEMFVDLVNDYEALTSGTEIPRARRIARLGDDTRRAIGLRVALQRKFLDGKSSETTLRLVLTKIREATREEDTEGLEFVDSLLADLARVWESPIQMRVGKIGGTPVVRTPEAIADDYRYGLLLHADLSKWKRFNRTNDVELWHIIHPVEKCEALLYNTRELTTAVLRTLSDEDC